MPPLSRWLFCFPVEQCLQTFCKFGCMVYIVKAGMKRKDFEALIRKATPKTRKGKKGFNAKKYCGVIKLDEDPMVIQRRLRDEWN